jgi:uncharacterized protein (TIGR03083 family)
VELNNREEFDEIVAAFALDACDADEMDAVERYVAAHPAAASEIERLRTVAAGLAASDALAPPRDVRASVLSVARERRAPRTKTPTEAHAEIEATLADLLDEVLNDLPESVLDRVTTNGLSVRGLVAHLAAMESLLAQWMGVPTLPEISIEGVENRTAAVLDATSGWPLLDVIALWRRSTAAVRAAVPGVGPMVPWFTSETPTDLAVLVSAFEIWTHTDDIRRAIGRPLGTPSAAALHTMAEGSMTMVPVALEASGLERAGRTARIELTGPGGGTWTVPMQVGGAVGEPDVAITLPLVEWCRRFSERLEVDELDIEVHGDRRLADDLVAAASVFARL